MLKVIVVDDKRSRLASPNEKPANHVSDSQA